MKQESSLISIIEIVLGLIKKIIGKPKNQENQINTVAEAIEDVKPEAVILEVLKNIDLYITKTADVSWSAIENIADFKTELNKDIIAISNKDYTSLSRYDTYFLPTGDFQEIAMSNGWGEEYLELAKKFETAYSNL